MTGVRERRELLGLTQGGAAAKAGVSLATWRRLETEPDATFRQSTVRAVEEVLKVAPGGLALLRAGEEPPLFDVPRPRESAWLERIAHSFTGDPLTPRQAFKIAMSTAGMDDDAFVQWDDYLRGRCGVDELWLICELPDWVLFIVNNLWLQRFREAIIDIGGRIEQGELPRTRCIAERVALCIVLDHAEHVSSDIDSESIEDDPDTAALFPHRGDVEDDWEGVAEALLDGDLDARMIWLPNFTRTVFGSPDGPYSAWHPFRWWETGATDG